MDSVFIYWDNSNIFHEAQRLAGGNPFLGAFLQPADAKVGTRKWRVCRIGRLLRGYYVHGAVQTRG